MRSARRPGRCLALVSCSADPVPTHGPDGPVRGRAVAAAGRLEEQRLQARPRRRRPRRRGRVVACATASGSSQAWLATGENAVPEALFGRRPARRPPTLDGDRRAEVLAATAAVHRQRRSRSTAAGWRRWRSPRTSRPWELAVGHGAALTCRPGGVVEEAVTTGPETVRARVDRPAARSPARPGRHRSGGEPRDRLRLSALRDVRPLDSSSSRSRLVRPRPRRPTARPDAGGHMATTQTTPDLSIVRTEHPNAARLREGFAAFGRGDLDARPPRA